MRRACLMLVGLWTGATYAIMKGGLLAKERAVSSARCCFGTG